MQINQDPRDSLSAASAAAKVPTPISTWTLDGTGGFNDSGPAAVNMTIVGSWTDLTTGSLVSGVGGTSACNAGTGAYATLPASQAAHNLGALTLSFYYQRNSMAAKHVLFAIGDGTAIGDLSIEVLANGLLRGYHVGGDGVLRFFESTNGITGARFPVGTARRIDVSLGAAGAQIFVDGAAYLAATIAANTNGWNNAAVKYLAVFPGPEANAVGLFDHVRLWNVQLSAAQIAALEPARSVTLVVPAPISTWTLNGTSGFQDTGAADVDFTITDTWADLTKASLVQGVSGTSAYTDGTGAYATLPANVAAHALSAMTLSFYYQRNGAAAKQVLFAVGDGASAGDLSLEVLPTGVLRGYHVGADGVLRFLEGKNGVTGTSFPVGTARRVDLTFGSRGVELYVDGIAYPAAAIAANTNGWNNGAVKYLGVFPGALSPSVGAFDHVRLWNVALTPAQISLLEPAVSIPLPSQPSASAGPATPAFAFVPSDGVLPASNLLYVHDTKLGNGSGSDAANAKELQAAMNAASPGQTLVAIASSPGGTSYYDRVDGVTLNVSGTSSAKIRLMARPGDTVVLDRGLEFATFRTPSPGQNTKWELFDSSKKIWRSVSTGFGGAFRRLGGVWKEFGTWHYLVPYKSLADLSLNVGTRDLPNSAGGPGACVHTDGRVYIRMQRPHAPKYSAGNRWPTDGRLFGANEISGGQLAYPVTEDPRDYEIWLCVYGGTAISGNAKQHWIIGEGINTFGHETAFKPGNPTGGSCFIEFRRCTFLYNRWGMQQSGGAFSNITYNRCRMGTGSTRHLSFVEFKFGSQYLEPIRGCNVECSNNAVSSDVTYNDCSIHNCFDLQVGGTSRYRWINCFINNLMDDGIQSAPTLANCEIGYCYFRDSAWIGFDGQQGQVQSTAWIVHHNIFDCRTIRVTDVNGTQPYPMALCQPHSPTGSNPKKIYNNLFIFMVDGIDQHASGVEHMDGGNNTSSIAHEVFNNIFIRCNGKVGDSNRYSNTANFEGSSDGVINLMLTNGTSREKWDYNVYWRDPAVSPQHGLFHYIRAQAGAPFQSFATLAAFRASALFTGSQSHYGPGFEANGFEFKPTFGTIDDFPASRLSYRPAPHQNLNTGQTSSLAGESTSGWPAQPSNWKGPLDPHGTTMPISVQNP